MKLSERFQEAAKVSRGQRDRILARMLDELDERLHKLEADPGVMGVRPHANAAVTSSEIDGEPIFFITVRDRRKANKWVAVQVDQTTLIDLWNAIEAAS